MSRLPVHEHPVPRMAHVLVVTDDETGYAAGEFVVEREDAWHRGRNDGATPLRLLVIDPKPEGQPNTVLQDP